MTWRHRLRNARRVWRVVVPVAAWLVVGMVKAKLDDRAARTRGAG